jgi:tetratricopeptide (TPR) repeat protein
MRTSKYSCVTILEVIGMVAVLLMTSAAAVIAADPTWNQTYLAAQRLDQRGQWPEALRTAKLALEKAKGAFGTDSLNVAKSQILLGDLWAERGKCMSAEMHYVKGIGLREKLLSPEHPSLVTPLTVLGDLYATQGKTEQAAFTYTRAITIGQWNDPASVGALVGLAGLSKAAGKQAETEILLNRALNLCETYAKYDGSLNLLAARTLNDLAELNSDRGNHRRAAECYHKALTALERGNSAEKLVTCSILTRLADAYTRYGSVALANNCRKRAMALYAKANGPTAARGLIQPEL